MKLKLLLSSFILLMTSCIYGQYYSRTHLDSIKTAMHQQAGIEQINTTLLLSEVYRMFSLDTALIYAKKAQKASQKNDYDWGYYKGLYCQAKANYQNKPADEVKPIAEKCAHWFEQNEYQKDAIYTRFLVVSIVGDIRGKKNAAVLLESLMSEVGQLNDNRLTAFMWMYRRKYEAHLINGNKQFNSIDSANYYFRLVKDSFNIISTRLLSNLSINGQKEAMEYCYQSLEWAKKWKNIHLTGEVSNYMGVGYAGGGSWIDSASHYLKSAIQFCDILKDKRSKASLNSRFGYAYGKVDSSELAIEYYQKAIKSAKHIKDINVETFGMNQLAFIYGSNGEYEHAINIVLDLIKLVEEIEDVYRINSCKRLLGNLYGVTEEPDKAESMYLEVLSWADTALVGQVKLVTRGNICLALGNICQDQKEYEKARSYFRMAVVDLTKRPVTALIADLSILDTYLEEKKLDSAKIQYTLINKSYTIDLLEKSHKFYLMKGNFLMALNQLKEGVKAFERYFELSKKTGFHEDLKLAYFSTYEAYQKIGDSDKALTAYVMYNMIDDSLKASETIENTRQVQSEYELSLKDAEIENLNKEKELQVLKLDQQNNALKLNQLYIVVLIFIVLFIAVIAYLVSRRIQAKKEREKLELKTKLELENLQASQKAEIAETKNTLFANVSHEFRTPLTLIKVPLENYMKKAVTEDQTMLKGVLNNTDHLLKMVDELLDLAKIETGDLELNSTTFDLNHLLMQTKANFSPIFQEKGVEFSWINTLPTSAIDGDENRLKIVLNNFLKNAYNHVADKGQVSCNIQLVEKKATQYFSISITNTGTNISAADLPHIFERFYRGDEERYVGNGIGLALSKQIVELHNGTISVDNTQSNQVTFKVLLPCVVLKDKATDEVESITQPKVAVVKENNLSTPNKQDYSSTDQPRILVVEDNLEMRQLLQTILKEDFELSFAENGAVGERAAFDTQPDLIVSDVMMPKKDGFELLQSVKTNMETSHIPIILLTAKADVESRISGFNQDADDYIDKPFNAEDLKARIHNILRQRENLQKAFRQNPLIFNKKLKSNPIDLEFLNKSIKILEENYHNGDFLVNEFCSALALNRNSVYNKIKALTDQNTSEYIRNFRLEKAALMLQETQETIAQISMSCGFNNPQTFNKAFRECFHVTPSDYRKK